MEEKDKVAQECDKLNRIQRKVQVGRGVLFDVPSDISGHLLVTGHENMASNLLYEYGRRADMSTIVLTSDSHLLEEIKNYHPMYGMTTQYQSGSSQKQMNLYLAEELYATVKRTDKLRIIADNIQFTGESDPLLTCLMQLKREGKIELVVIAPNIREMIPAGVPLDFPNIIFTDHYNDKTTEDISRELFGTYQYHYPACTAGCPAAMLFTMKKDIHWNIGSEEQLRLKPGDLYIAEMLFGGIMVREDETDLSWRYGSKEEYGAVKFAGDNCIYLYPINQPCHADT